MISEKKAVSFRFRVLLVVSICLLMFLAVLITVYNLSVTQMISHSEKKFIEEQRSSISALLELVEENTDATAKDWAAWPDVISYVKGDFDSFIKENWRTATPLKTLREDIVVFTDSNYNELFAEFYDLENDVLIPAPSGFTNAVIAHSGSDTKSGYFIYQGVPYYLCIAPVYDRSGPTVRVGTIILGRPVSEKYLRIVTRLGNVNFNIEGSESESGAIEPYVTDEERVAMLIELRSLDGGKYLLSASDNRVLYKNSRSVSERTTLILICSCAAFLVVTILAYERLIIKPFRRINKDISEIDKNESLDASKYENVQEFQLLCSSINKMLERLNESEEQEKRNQISISTMTSILNGMDANLYATDPKTDKILFINDKMREHFGLPEDMTDSICWQVLQENFTERCDFCPNHKLEKEPDVPVVWEEHNTVTKRYYKNTDTMIPWTGDTMAHLQHSIDISDIKEAEAALKKRLEQQELMSAISQSFISGDSTDVLISRGLKLVGEFLGTGKIMLGRIDYETEKLNYEYFWYNKEKSISPIEKTSFRFLSDTPQYEAFAVRNQPYLAVNNVSNHEEYRNLEQLGVKSFISLPVKIDDKLWGILTIDDYSLNYVWTNSDVQLLRLIVNVIAGVIDRSVTEEQLYRMSLIVDSSPQFIFYADDTGKVHYVNKGAEIVTGYTVEELTEGGLVMLHSPEANEMIGRDIVPEIHKQGHIVVNLPVIRKDNQLRTLSFMFFAIDLAKAGIGAIAYDITESLEMQREIIASKEQAEQSNRAKSEFLSRMSHEMRTPMNAIIGMTSIAKSTEELNRKNYCLDRIDEASKHLLGVINDILDMSKIEANKFELSFSEFVFPKMIRRTTNVIAFRIDEKELKLAVDIDPLIPDVIVSDEQRLAQVITNILSNAVKFTPELGSITLNAKLIDEAEEGCLIQIEIRDTGIGITQEQIGKLFRSFEQADGGISRRFGGTGLGLAISKNIVEMLNGKIWVESEPEKGSSFFFTFRARRGHESPKPLFSPGMKFEDLRILAVDDSPDILEYFKALTDSFKLGCDVAESGERAIELLDAGAAYNVVFVDWRMPGMDGIELTRHIKANSEGEMVVIMISASEWSEIEEKARGAGVDRFIPKPLFASEILDCLNSCIGIGEAPAEEPASDEEGCFEGYRILLAEDIEINSEIVISLLEHTGIEIELAENGRIAYEKFSADPGGFDMIFMDIHMPEVDGFQATRIIRAMQIPEAKTVPIVAMTANVFREDIEKCLDAGMLDHVGKPVDINDIIAKLRKYLPKK